MQAELSLLAAALRQYAEGRGLSQAELAQQLQTSQATISRVLSVAQMPDPKLRQRIWALVGLSAGPVVGSQDWVEAVSDAAQRSPAFALIVATALKLLNLDE